MNTYLNPDAIQDRSIEPIKLNSTIIEVTYTELKALRDNAQLIPGQQYRITDYVTSTTQENTISANHQFDIIVTADSENTLNEVARATPHEGDTYFATSDLNAWEIWYCLDNDTERFAWADENGKGVIYRMIDERGNECPYDFKNIKFYHDGLGTDVYTFTWIDESYNVMDTSVFGNNGVLTYEGEIKGVHGNIIKPYMGIIYDDDSGDYLGTKQSLNNITFISDYEYVWKGNNGFYGCYSNIFGNDCYNNSFGNECYNNSFGNDCHNNSFGNECYNNRFGNRCQSNSFGYNCYYNNLANACSVNNFGNNCYSNNFYSSCWQNTFGNNCQCNSFGSYFQYNSFGNYCQCNSFGNYFQYNSFGSYFQYNSFGNYCRYNSFRLSASKTGTLLNYCQYNHFDNGCSYNVIWNATQSNYSNRLQNINVVRGVSGTSSTYNFVNITTKNTAYEIKVAKNSSGTIKIYCEAD